MKSLIDPSCGLERLGLASQACLRHTAAMLEIRDLSLSVFIQEEAVEAVSEVSLTLQAGRVLGLVGESGCGKSLTAQSILRLGEHQGVSKSHGDILLDGESLFEMDDETLRKMRGGRVAMVFQEPMTALNPVFSIGSQITEVIRLHLDMNKKQAMVRAANLLRDVGMQDADQVLKQYPDALSGGMRQRVLIAMAMAADPDFIIADEPTTALDVSVQKRIIALLLSLQQKRHLGLLLVTHDFGLVAEMCDDVAVMYAGQIVESGSVRQIFDQPAHPYTRALMGCRPEVSEVGDALPVIAGQVPQPGGWPVGCHFAARCPLRQQDCQCAGIAANAWSNEAWIDSRIESGMDSGIKLVKNNALHVARCLHVESKGVDQS